VDLVLGRGRGLGLVLAAFLFFRQGHRKPSSPVPPPVGRGAADILHQRAVPGRTARAPAPSVQEIKSETTRP